MSRRLLVAQEARDDIAEALQWLNERSPGSPARFRSSLKGALDTISKYPEMFPITHREIRRALLRHFPYSVFYIAHGELILVLGVIHQARHPSAWKRRWPN